MAHQPARRNTGHVCLRRARVLGGAIILSLSSSADAGTWIGPIGGNWNNPAHWSDGVVPPEGGAAVISGSTAPATVVVDAFYANPLSISITTIAPTTSFPVTIDQSVPGSQVWSRRR
jgi:hypothetical protein